MSTIIYYPIPIHRQPAYAHLGLNQGSLLVTEQLCSQVLSLPISLNYVKSSSWL